MLVSHILEFKMDQSVLLVINMVFMDKRLRKIAMQHAPQMVSIHVEAIQATAFTQYSQL